MVTVNPRKISHGEQFQQEVKARLDRYERLEKLITSGDEKAGRTALDFSSQKGYHRFVMAFYLAAATHKDQLDKAGMPYILHPVTVAAYIHEAMEPSKDRDRMMTAALLHDVLEDSPMTGEVLKMFGFGGKIAGIVRLLSRDKDEDYDDYLARLEVSYDAMAVKRADLKDNMNLNRLPEPSQRDIRRSEFYRHRYMKLDAVIKARQAEREMPEEQTEYR